MGVAIVIVNHLRIVATTLHEILPLCAGVEQGPPNGVIGAEEGPLIPMA
jgi:hypothetical protein